jgi:hypothetical protein
MRGSKNEQGSKTLLQSCRAAGRSEQIEEDLGSGLEVGSAVTFRWGWGQQSSHVDER